MRERITTLLLLALIILGCGEVARCLVQRDQQKAKRAVCIAVTAAPLACWRMFP